MEVQQKFRELIQELYASDGNDSYNGTFTTCSGLKICDNEFVNQSLARSWIEENAKKWENVLAVKFWSTEETLTKQPTFNDGMQWDAFDTRYEFPQLTEAQEQGQPVPLLKCCLTDALSSRVGSSYNYNVFPADQLTEARRDRLKDVVTDYIEARVHHIRLNTKFNGELADIRDINKSISQGRWVDLRKTRKSLITNLNARTRLAEKLVELNSRLNTGLWETSFEENGEFQWMLGGLCAM
jgi:hypothetical protein